MRLPRIFKKEYRGSIFLGGALTFVVWNAFSFGWFGLPNLGFYTAGGAEQLAVARMEKVAVPLAAELCAIKFNEQDLAIAADKVKKLKAAAYTRAKSEQLEQEWVTLGGARDPNQRVVEACAELILAAPVQKSADTAPASATGG